MRASSSSSSNWSRCPAGTLARTSAMRASTSEAAWASPETAIRMAEKCVRHFECRRLGDVEAIDEAIADQIEIGGNRRARFAGDGPQARQHQRGIPGGCKGHAGSRVAGERPLEALHLAGATRGHF